MGANSTSPFQLLRFFLWFAADPFVPLFSPPFSDSMPTLYLSTSSPADPADAFDWTSLTEEQVFAVQLYRSLTESTPKKSFFSRIVDPLVSYVLIPAVVLAHLFFLAVNLDMVEVSVVVDKSMRFPKAFLIATSVLYGFLLSGAFFYWRQLDLTQQLAAYAKKEQEAKTKFERKDEEFKKMKKAASHVVVPYRLDALTEKGLDNFMTESYRPAFHAERHPTHA